MNNQPACIIDHENPNGKTITRRYRVTTPDGNTRTVLIQWLNSTDYEASRDEQLGSFKNRVEHWVRIK